MNLEKYGPWALVVGGSEGVGAAYARLLAADGFNLVLVARKQGPLDEIADEVRKLGVEVRTASIDLSRTDAIDEARKVTDDIDVGLLIYNAGANNTRGTVVDLDPAVYRSVINITVLGQTEFAHHYGALMKARGKGGIILSGSSSNFLGSATLAPYTGAKAYSRIFTEALWAECKPMGIDVLHNVIGFTATPAMQRLGMDTTTAQSPEDVAQEALDAIADGPLWFHGGPAAFELAVKRSQLDDRAGLIATIATPRREDIPGVKAST